MSFLRAVSEKKSAKKKLPPLVRFPELLRVEVLPIFVLEFELPVLVVEFHILPLLVPFSSVLRFARMFLISLKVEFPRAELPLIGLV